MIGKMLRIPLYLQIFAALLLALLIALPEILVDLRITPSSLYSEPVRDGLIFWLGFIGDLFLRALRMIVVPLIISSVITAIAKLGEQHAFGRLGLKTITYYLVTTTLAVLIGLLWVNLIRPGQVDEATSEVLLAQVDVSKGELEDKIQTSTGGAVLLDVLKRMIPTNVFNAFTNNGEMLAIIFFSILFGYFITRLPEQQRDPFTSWWSSFYDVMLKMTDFIIIFAPIGVLGLVGATLLQTGLDVIGPLFKFFIVVLLALGTHFFITMPLLLMYFGASPTAHYRHMASAIITAFSTASSSATVPVTIECLEKNAKVPKPIANFITPLGATVNMDGTALYECVAVVFIAQVYGFELTIMAQFTIVFLSLATSIGVAGVPSASLVAIVIILAAVGLPMEAVGMILAVDRILDMCRTATNVFSDSCGAVIITRSEAKKEAAAL